MDCPSCGHPVRIHSSGEGTNSYEPVCDGTSAIAALRALLEACREALRMGIQSPYEARNALLVRLDEQLKKK